MHGTSKHLLTDATQTEGERIIECWYAKDWAEWFSEDKGEGVIGRLRDIALQRSR